MHERNPEMSDVSTTQYYEQPFLFDLVDATDELHELRFEEEAAQTAYHLGVLAMRFARVERVPRYDEHSRENDAEHSFMLSLVATELAATYYSELDVGLVAQYSTVHDLIELETGDVATFALDDTALAAKESAEHTKIETICGKLPPYTRRLLVRYELQLDPEARFVRLVDKSLPLISDIAGPGRKVMEEDYGIYTAEQLDANEDRFSARLRERFPEKELEFIHAVRDLLAERFSAEFAETYG
jgi:5'-deoxynucleotidase YfbR-like HD superfamily hydrolase